MTLAVNDVESKSVNVICTVGNLQRIRNRKRNRPVIMNNVVIGLRKRLSKSAARGDTRKNSQAKFLHFNLTPLI